MESNHFVRIVPIQVHDETFATFDLRMLIYNKSRWERLAPDPISKEKQNAIRFKIIINNDSNMLWKREWIDALHKTS